MRLGRLQRLLAVHRLRHVPALPPALPVQLPFLGGQMWMGGVQRLLPVHRLAASGAFTGASIRPLQVRAHAPTLTHTHRRHQKRIGEPHSLLTRAAPLSALLPLGELSGPCALRPV